MSFNSTHYLDSDQTSLWLLPLIAVYTAEKRIIYHIGGEHPYSYTTNAVFHLPISIGNFEINDTIRSRTRRPIFENYHQKPKISYIYNIIVYILTIFSNKSNKNSNDQLYPQTYCQCYHRKITNTFPSTKYFNKLKFI